MGEGPTPWVGHVVPQHAVCPLSPIKATLEPVPCAICCTCAGDQLCVLTPCLVATSSFTNVSAAHAPFRSWLMEMLWNVHFIKFPADSGVHLEHLPWTVHISALSRVSTWPECTRWGRPGVPVLLDFIGAMWNDLKIAILSIILPP